MNFVPRLHLVLAVSFLVSMVPAGEPDDDKEEPKRKATPKKQTDGDFRDARDFRKVVGELLKADGLTRAAMKIRDRKYLRDPSRQLFPDPQPHLPAAVRAALDQPLDQPGELLGAARAMWNGPGIVPSFDRLGRMLDATIGGGAGAAPPPRPQPAVPPLPAAPKGFDPATWKPVARLLVEIALLEQAVARYLAPLQEDERAHLRKWLPLWVTRTPADAKKKLKSGEEDVAERDALLRCAVLLARTDAAALRLAWRRLLVAARAELPRLRAGAARVAIGGKPVVHAGAALFGRGNNRIDLRAKLVIDFGGSDEYRVAANAPQRPVQVVIDLSGDDLYLSQGPLCWGAALLGCSLHVDVAGDDDYRGRDWSLGCGLAGHGALWDLSGRDRYYGGLGVQGVGVFGTGLLLDDGGDDEYSAGCFAQGFGSSGGAGAIVDRGGDDVYTAGRDEEDIWRRPGTYVTFAQGSGYSHRFGHIWTDETGKRRWKITGQIPGGVGLLFDRSGNDRYEADVFGQGSAYWYSLGALVDGGGNDRYRATWYGQGVGTHAAVGVVVDRSGNDWYFSRNTSQGCGHDFSAGLLVDHAGDDIYAGLTLCQGAGNAASGLGLLADGAGNDRYRCGSRCWGYGSDTKTEELRPFGFLLDGGGANTYTGWKKGAARPGTRWKHPPRGYGLDGANSVGDER